MEMLGVRDFLTLLIPRDSSLVKKIVNVDPRRIYRIFQMCLIPNKEMCLLFFLKNLDNIFEIIYYILVFREKKSGFFLGGGPKSPSPITNRFIFL